MLLCDALSERSGVKCDGEVSERALVGLPEAAGSRESQRWVVVWRVGSGVEVGRSISIKGEPLAGRLGGGRKQ